MTASHSSKRNVTDWLLEADPAIRWQVMRDLLDAPEAEWRAERSKIATRGWGAELLSHEDADGQWAGGAFFPAEFSQAIYEAEGQPWTATAWALKQLRDWGLDPASSPARRAVELIGANSRWEHDGQPYWEGEVEECINGRTVADGAYFGVDVSPIVERLIGEQLEDGGWNCERANGSTRSSFHTTVNVLEGLLEFERVTGGTATSIAAREAGAEYLLDRRLFRRLSTGRPADDAFLNLANPTLWKHDILRGLDYFRGAGMLTGGRPDSRLGEAIEALRSKRGDDGRWPVEIMPTGRVWFHVDDGVGEPSRWVTLRACRLLRWADDK